MEIIFNCPNCSQELSVDEAGAEAIKAEYTKAMDESFDKAKAAEMFPKSRTSILAAYKAGVKIAVGTDEVAGGGEPPPG